MNFWSFKTIGRFANSDREFYFSVNCALIPIYSWQCIQRENDGSGLRKIATAVRDIGVAVARAELTNIHQYEICTTSDLAANYAGKKRQQKLRYTACPLYRGAFNAQQANDRRQLPGVNPDHC